MRTRWTSTLAMAAALTWSAAARAQDPGASQQSAVAVSLFEEAQKLAAAGNHAAACPKFVEVRRTLPTAGLHLNLGDCYEHLGKLASAWGAFTEAEIIARNGRDPDREAEAVKRARAILGKLSRLTISVGAGERMAGLVIKRDGVSIGEGQWGSAVPVDAADHLVELSAPGHRSWSTHVAVGANAASVSVAVPRLAPEEAQAAPSALPSSWWTGQRIAGVAIGGVGVVGLAVGAVMGAQAMGKNSESKEACQPADPDACTSAGAALRKDAFTLAHLSTASFAVGGAALVGGVVLLATAKTPSPAAVKSGLRAAPLVGPGLAGVMVSGMW